MIWKSNPGMFRVNQRAILFSAFRPCKCRFSRTTPEPTRSKSSEYTVAATLSNSIAGTHTPKLTTVRQYIIG